MGREARTVSRQRRNLVGGFAALLFASGLGACAGKSSRRQSASGAGGGSGAASSAGSRLDAGTGGTSGEATAGSIGIGASAGLGVSGRGTSGSVGTGGTGGQASGAGGQAGDGRSGGAGGKTDGGSGTSAGEGGTDNPYAECPMQEPFDNSCPVEGSTCSRTRGCEPPCERTDGCPAPQSGSASPYCNFGICVLECDSERTCPDEMLCGTGWCNYVLP
jgi:hypothetical protein